MVRPLLLGASLPLMLILSTHAYSQADSKKESPPPWEFQNATPGVVLTLQELRRWTKDSKQGADYRVVVSGLPKDKIFKLWQKNLGREPEFVFLTVYLDDSGDLVFEAPNKKFRQVSVSLSGLAKGEPVEYALISTDQTVRAFTRVILFPIESKDGPCLLSMQLGSPRGDLFLVIGQGFEPDGEATTESRSDVEVLRNKVRLTRDGKFATVVAPAVVGKRSGKASFTASAKDCSPTVDYEWGAPETNADPVLKKSVTDLLKRLENAYYSCSPLRLRVTDTRVTIPFDGTSQQEKWEVLSCNGETHLYEVTFTPHPGGTTFGVRKWPE